jgi:phosphatidate cytidylyltransferase
VTAAVPDLLLPATLRVGTALAVALAAIVAVESRRGRLRDLGTSTLFVRWRTWALAAPLFGAAVVWPLACLLFVIALAWQGVREFSVLVGLTGWARRLLLTAAILTPVVAVMDFTSWRAMPPLLLLVATLPPLVAQDCDRGATRLAFTGLGFAYIPWLLTYVWLLREHTVGGPGVLLAVGVAVATSDVFAYVLGRALPSAKLAPRVSPGKTVAGVAGNLVGAGLGLWLMQFARPEALARPLYFGLAVVIAAGCVWGDLLESLLKRQFGVKDTGVWLPGFGGLLDRIDSLIVTAPLVYTVQVVGTTLLGGAR